MAWLFSSKVDQTIARLIETEIDLLYRIAMRLSRNPADAEDLVQETCLRAWRARDQLRTPDEGRAWLCRILRNAWIDRCRRDHRALEIAETADEWGIIESDFAPPVLLPSDERDKIEEAFDAQVVAALDSLPQEERIAVLLHTFGNMTYREISRAMDCPIGTVMSRLHRARAKLRGELARYAQAKGIVSRNAAAKRKEGGAANENA